MTELGLIAQTLRRVFPHTEVVIKGCKPDRYICFDYSFEYHLHLWEANRDDEELGVLMQFLERRCSTDERAALQDALLPYIVKQRLEGR